MYKIALCDDEPIFLREICELCGRILQEQGIPHQLSAFRQPGPLSELVEQDPERFHLLVLDILMRQNGIEVAKELRRLGYRSSILFVTITREFSLEGYQVFPIHYLLKPVEAAQLRQVLLRDYHQNFLPHRLALPVLHGIQLIRLDDILYIESLNRRTLVHTTQQVLESTGTLQSLSRLVPAQQFAQCHKSFLVHLSKVVQVQAKALVVQGGDLVPLGRSYRSQTLSRLYALLSVF